MPVTATCPDHPELGHLYPGDIIAHAAADHPGEPLAEVDAKIIVRFAPQDGGRGTKLPRRFRCRYCAAEVATTDPDRPPYCDTHLDRAAP